ncbi:uncharacterized protein LOC144722151 [Lampetra planeri]
MGVTVVPQEGAEVAPGLAGDQAADDAFQWAGERPALLRVLVAKEDAKEPAQGTAQVFDHASVHCTVCRTLARPENECSGLTSSGGGGGGCGAEAAPCGSDGGSRLWKWKEKFVIFLSAPLRCEKAGGLQREPSMTPSKRSPSMA